MNNDDLPATAQAVWSATPQGLLARVNPESSWREVLLAQNTVADSFFQLRFLNLVPELQAALQTNQLFVVATQNRYLGTPTATPGLDGQPYFQNEMSIEQWAFKVNTGIGQNYSEKSNVLILKFCDGTLYDRVKNPGIWEDAAGFNAVDPNNLLPNELTATSQWLQDYCEQALLQYDGGKGNTLFENFCTVINDPYWYGVLFLKVDLDMLQFPAEIKGVLAGMDTTRLNGHHIGIEISRVHNETDSLQMVGNSSLFGLINYIDPAYQQMLANADGKDVSNVPVAPPAGVDYDFKVLSLQVLFDNAQIKAFRKVPNFCY